MYAVQSFPLEKEQFKRLIKEIIQIPQIPWYSWPRWAYANFWPHLYSVSMKLNLQSIHQKQKWYLVNDMKQKLENIVSTLVAQGGSVCYFRCVMLYILSRLCYWAIDSYIHSILLVVVSVFNFTFAFLWKVGGLFPWLVRRCRPLLT